MFDKMESVITKIRRRVIERIMLRHGCDAGLAKEAADNYDEGIDADQWAGRLNGSAQLTPEQFARLVELLKLVLSFLAVLL